MVGEKRRIEVVRFGEQRRAITNIGGLVWVEGSIVQTCIGTFCGSGE
jgi:hypothetical protein